MMDENGHNNINYTSKLASSSSFSSEDDEDGKRKKEAKRMVPFHKLFMFADSKDVLLMIVGAVAAISNGAAQPLMTLLFGELTDAFGQTTDIHDVVHEVSKVCIKFVYLATGSGVASFLQVACWMATGERQAARIRNLYLKTLLCQEIAFFDKETNAGEVIGRLSGDTVLIQDAIGEKVGKFIQLITTFFGGFLVAFIKGWLLTLVMLSALPPLIIAAGVTAFAITQISTRELAAYSDAVVVVEETIGAIRTVASFTGEKQVMKKYAEAMRGAYNSAIHKGLATGLGIGIVMFFMFAGYALGIWSGGMLILKKGYTGGDVINVIFALLTCSFYLGQASPCIGAFAAGRAAAQKMFKTINRKPEIDAFNSNGKIFNDIHGDIEFKDVYFSYATRPHEKILRGFSLHIRKGTTVALVGQSGSGKSTVISLIERFYDPLAGKVLIDGINLKEFQLRWIRGKIGLVSQEPVLFATSIRENIVYGKDDATVEEIRKACQLANASNFIDKLPHGLDTMVGEHGIQLSGGQKQRVAIARAILKDPSILLLDEATSALDAESERIVQEALERIMTKRTTVLVAHRLSTVRDADTIVVMHQGSIIEKGSHSELLKIPDGAYCKLIRLQEVNNDANQGKADVFIDKESQSRQYISQGFSMGSNSLHCIPPPLIFPVNSEISGGTSQHQGCQILSQQTTQIPLSRLAYLNKPELPELILGSFASIANGLIYPAFGLLLSNVVNAFYQPPHKLEHGTRKWALVFLNLAMVSLFAFSARAYFFAVAGAKLIRRITSMVLEKTINMEIAWFDDYKNTSGSIAGRLSADTAVVRGLVGDALALLVHNMAALIGALVVAFVANWKLSMVNLALIPLMGLNEYFQIKAMKGFSSSTKTMHEEASQIANEAIGSIRTVASFSAEDRVMTLYRKKCEGPIRKGIRQGIISGIGFGVSFFVLFCAYAIIFYVGARLIEDGKTTFEKVFRVFFALCLATIGITQSSSGAQDSTNAKSTAASIFATLDRKSRIDPSDQSGLTLEAIEGNIEFHRVSFRYPSRPDIPILQDFFLAIQSGKTVALVGESGSGKSTTVSLLQRFYDPDAGHILLDGIELQKFQLRWLRQQMGLVSQEPVLFNDTIRANIAYGKEGNASEAEIVAAAESANAHKFISGLQQGYDTVVGKRGTQLSGGQKQRIAIARAIIKNPKIMLLDEATSALDVESERLVQDALDRVKLNRTTLVIAQRLSTIKNADLIAVMKNGAIIESGKHESLINIEGAYASMVSLYLRAT